MFIALLSLAYSLTAQEQIDLSVNGTHFTVSLTDNPATEALLRHLRQGEVRVETSRYGGFEQVEALPWSLPAVNSQTTAAPGDVILYNGNQLVVFFGSNSWNYTRLGRIENASPSALRRALDVPSCRIILSLSKTTGIHGIRKNPALADERIYDLQGRLVSRPLEGIYIRNGKKIYL